MVIHSKCKRGHIGRINVCLVFNISTIEISILFISLFSLALLTYVVINRLAHRRPYWPLGDKRRNYRTTISKMQCMQFTDYVHT